MSIFGMLVKVVLAAVFATVQGVACAQTDLEAERLRFKRPDTVPFPASAPYNREIAMLGKMLFFDPRLSAHQNMSCATCHNPSFGWEAPLPLAIGSQNTALPRHSPTILNLAWEDSLFWDGRAPSLELQAIGPITAKEEMNMSFDVLVERLSNVREYRDHFTRLFPDTGLSKGSILGALATFERTVVSRRAPFDRWVNGEENAISPGARRGFALFVGDAQCADCHSGWRFTNGEFFNVGSPFFDGAIPDEYAANRAVKVPTLRNISLRAPYMHQGNIATLADVVRHYATETPVRATLDSTPFEIEASEVEDLVAFLKTLTEEGQDVRSPVLPAN